MRKMLAVVNQDFCERFPNLRGKMRKKHSEKIFINDLCPETVHKDIKMARKNKLE
jgi:hypothetical protein